MGDEAHLTDADSFTLQMETDPLLRSTIVAIAWLAGTPDQELLKNRIERATRLVPNFRRRLEPGWGPLSPPRWVEDSNFDLSWHLRRVAAPQPATIDTVLELARLMGMTAFDPIRPRWEAVLVEGVTREGTALTGTARTSTALVLKLHHALTDGIGGIELAHHLFDLDGDTEITADLPPEPASESGGWWPQVTSAARFDVQRAADVVASGVRAVPAAVRAVSAHPLRIWEDVAGTLLSALRMTQPITDTMSPVMTERRLSWRFSAIEVPLDELRDAAHGASGTLNDAFLAGIAGGLAHYHRDHDAEVEHLRVTMPISLRTPDDPPGGNRVSLVRVPVLVGNHDPISRMIAIDESSRRWRAEVALPHSGLIAGALNLLPTAVTAGMLRHIDLVASNVPGFPIQVHLAGCAVNGFWVFGPPIGAAANITLISYRSQCCIGINTDASAVPDPEHFLDCVRIGFDEVLAVSDTAARCRIVGRSWWDD